MTDLIAITGGIGAGKSTVSRILRAMGYPVYDCDAEARWIIDNNDKIKVKIKQAFGTEAYRGDGSLDRPFVSRIVFSDPEKLRQLNEITHQTVKEDLMAWVSRVEGPKAFVETAILYQSGLDRMVSAVWMVTAPESLRVSRVMERSGLSAEQVAERIAAQNHQPDRQHSHVHEISNDGRHSLLKQVDALL